MGDQPVRANRPSARLQDPVCIAGQRLLIRDVDDRVLAEHDVDTRVRQRHGAGLGLSDLYSIPKSRAFDLRLGVAVGSDFSFS